jgi:hypothetical protein
MGCNCKKNNREVQVVNVTVVPETPEDLLNQQLKEWNGGVNEITEENNTEDGKE